jgi:hypothetical protein
MENPLVRAQHYLDLARQMHRVARLEPDEDRRERLMDLAEEYSRLAENILRAVQDITPPVKPSSGHALH